MKKQNSLYEKDIIPWKIVKVKKKINTLTKNNSVWVNAEEIIDNPKSKMYHIRPANAAVHKPVMELEEAHIRLNHVPKRIITLSKQMFWISCVSSSYSYCLFVTCRSLYDCLSSVVTFVELSSSNLLISSGISIFFF